MPYNSITALPDSVRNRLSEKEQRVWLRVFNRTFRTVEGDDKKRESAAFRAANGFVRNMDMKKDAVFSKLVDVEKVDEEQRMVWGWAYACTDEAGQQVVDHSGDVVELGDIQKAAEDFMLESRVGNVMHGEQGGFICQSVVITDEVAKELGITMLKRGWFIGFKVTDDDAWEKVKAGKLKAFSIGGSAQTEEVADGD